MAKQDLIEISLHNLSKAVALAEKLSDICGIEKESNKDALASILPIISDCANRLYEAQMTWNVSKIKGQYAVSSYGECAVDIQLLKSEKLDFDQMKAVIKRKKLCTTFIENLKFIEQQFDAYLLSCNLAGFILGEREAQKILEELILQKDSLKSEYDEMKSQLDNVKLYHQSIMISKTVSFAKLSLVISSLAIAFSVIQGFL